MSPELSEKARKTDFADKIWNFFTSLKLVIALLLVLAVLSIAGTIIEQNKPLSEYYRFYEPGTVAFFDKVGLLDMYHSWWFISCLALLALNLLACTMDRYTPIMRGLRKKDLILDDKLEKTLHLKEKIKYALPLETVEKSSAALAGKIFSGRPRVTKLEDGSRHYFFEKGKYSRLAFFFTHLSVLLIFIGALIGSFFGYKGYVNIFEGEGIYRVETRAGGGKDLNFTVRCNSFRADFYPSGAPKDYQSDLSIIQNGKEVLRKTIRVNDPLTFQGITFYQSSYGALPDQVQLEVRNQDGTLRGVVAAPFNRKVAVPGGNEQVEVADYQERFRLPDGSDGGPAVGINIYPEQGQPSGFWLLVNYPEYDKMRRATYSFQVKGLTLKKYTGLQVNKDPGEITVWVGSLLLIGGIMAAFFISHKKLWMSLRKDKKGRVELTVAGTANKNRTAFSGEIRGLIQSLREVS